MNQEWKKWGNDNPYYGVCSANEFKKEHLNENLLDNFFKSGQEHISYVTNVIKKYITLQLQPQNTLDFGCGVGRLLIPLSSISKTVDGIDISAGMLQEAKKILDARKINNVGLIKSSGSLTTGQKKYDFIHSYIVFQHVATVNGMKIYHQLLDMLQDGGIGALHFTYCDTAGAFKRLKRKLLKVLVINQVNNILTGQKMNTPNMQMNAYSINLLLKALQERGITNLHVEYTNHSGYLGVMLFFQKPPANP